MSSTIDLNKNGHLIFENVPGGTEIGIDYHSWYVGPRFRGISNIPPGFHYIFFSSADKHGQLSPRTSFFQYIEDGDIVVKFYDVENEDLKDDLITADMKTQYSNDLEEIAKYLAPYPQKECRKWPNLVRYVTIDIMERLQPVCGKLNFLSEVSLDTAGHGKKSHRCLDSRLPHKEDPALLIRFSKIPNDFPNNITAEEKTKHSLDSSYFLETLVRSFNGGCVEILGELQMAFICFLIGQIYDSFDHWKALVTLVTNCRSSMGTRSKFYKDFIDVISNQVEEIPEDFFVDIVAQNNFLVKTFQNFFHNTATLSVIDGTLLKKVSMLRNQLEKKFDCIFVEEDDDETPVIVDL